MRHWVDPQHKEAFISELKAVKDTRKYKEFAYSSTADTRERRALLEKYKREVGIILLQYEKKEARCYPCDMCEKTFKQVGALKQHRAFVHDIDVRWHPCDICEKKFKDAGNLKRHRASVHRYSPVD